MNRGIGEWLANATVEDIVGALFALAIGVGFLIGCTVYLIRHRGES